MATLSELYQKGEIREDQLGILAKAVICAKLGCRTNGQEAVFGSHVLQLADSLPPRREQGPVKGAQQTRSAPAAAKAAAEAPTARRDAVQNTQAARPSTPQPMQRPTVKPADQRLIERTSLAKSVKSAEAVGERRPGQTNVQKATKVSPLFPSEDRVQPRPSATTQKSVAQLQREANPSTATQKPATPSPSTSEKREAQIGIIDQSRLDELSKSVAKEAKADVAMVRVVLTNILNYLNAYPSVGILRLIDDVTRKTKADPRVIKVAIEILRDIDIIEVVDGVVVNLKKR